MLRLATVVFACTLLIPCAAAAVTHTVDVGGTGDYLTIQEGIDASSSGDTVLVFPGTYTGANNRGLDFGGRNIVLLASGNSSDTSIDCGNADRGFYFHSGEDTTAIVEGFTIRNGLSNSGGGIYCQSATPKFSGCVIRDCESTNLGGGATCWTGGHARFLCCDFIENESAVFGGGIYAQACSPRWAGCIFRENISNSQGGGGAMCYLCNGTFDDCSFYDNYVTSGRGGGIYTQESDVTVVSCLFALNEAGNGGAMALTADSDASVTYTSIVNNTSTNRGGGIFVDVSAPVIESCTLAANESASGASGLHFWDASPTIANCIIAFGTDGPAVTCTESRPTMPSITHCFVYGNAGGDSLCGAYHDNRFENPLLCDISARDVRLCADSPCQPSGNDWSELVGCYGQGCPPCGSPVETISWGAIKAIFR